MPGHYISVLDGPRWSRILLLGPFRSKARALEVIPLVRKRADELDPRASHWAFGTTKVEETPLPEGSLNAYVPVEWLA